MHHDDRPTAKKIYLAKEKGMKNKVISILLSVLLVVTSFIPMAYTAEPVTEPFGNWDIISKTNAENQMPDKLENGQIWTGKKVTYLNDGIFEIELNAIGQKYRAETELDRDQYDVVLVLDRSASMRFTSTGSTKSRMENVKIAAQKAAEELLKVNGNRVAVISYAGMASQEIGFSMDATAINTKIDSIQVASGSTPEGGTNIQNAFLVTENLLKSRGPSDRKSAVILMSDGEPTFYHTSLDTHKKSNFNFWGDPVGGNRLGNGTSTGAEYSWNTILQANKLKNSISNLDIYTIGFGATGDEAERTLMPTATNTESIRPMESYYESRGVEQTGTQSYKRTSTRTRSNKNKPWSDWSSWSSYEKDGDLSQVEYSSEGLWNRIISEPGKTYQNVYSPWVEIGEFIEGVTKTELNWRKTVETRTQYATKENFRTGTEYRQASSKLPFNHKYYHDLSTMTGDGAADILKVFTDIATSLTEFQPNQIESDSAERSNIIITDVIGEGFELVDPENYAFNEDTRTLTWTINGDELNTMDVDAEEIDSTKLHSLKFKVKLKDSLKDAKPANVNEEKIFMTNASANATFAVLKNNEFYKERTLESTVILDPITQSGSIVLKPAVGIVTEKHVDENDNVLFSTEHERLLGTELSIGPNNLDGTYELLSVSHETVEGMVNVVVSRDPQVVEFKYGKKPKLTVIVVGQGEVSPGPGEATYSRGQKVDLSVLSAGTGYVFSHWDGAQKDDNGNYFVEMTGDKVVTAVFVPVVEQVKLTTGVNLPGAGTVTPAGENTYDKGKTVEVTAAANEGFKFSHWSDGSSSTSAAITVTLNADTTLTANFVEEVAANLTLSATPLNPDMGEVIGTKNGSHEPNTPVDITAVPYDGYEFVHWLKGEEVHSTEANLQFVLETDTVLVAVFKPVIRYYELNALVNGGGTIETVFENKSYQEGTEITLKAVKNDGYTFTGWTGDITRSDETVTFTMDKNMTVVANFEKVVEKTYVLDAKPNDKVMGKVIGSENISYKPNTPIDITAVANEGFKFVHWLKGEAVFSTEANLKFDITEDTTLVAVFAPIPVYTLKINVVGEGVVTPANNEYREGTEVTVTAAPKSGYRFVGWSGDLTSDKAEDKVIMNTNKVLTATFVKIEKVSLTVNIIGQGTVNPEQREFEKGTVVNLVANPSTGWRFVNWSGDASSTTETLTLTMDTDKTLTAQFAEVSGPGPGPGPGPVIPPAPEPLPPLPTPNPTPTPTPVPTPEAEVVIEPEATPEGPATEEVVEEVALEEEAVPEGPAVEETPAPTPEAEVVEEIELLEESVPEGSALPQTGQLPTSLFFGIGSVIMAAGVYLKRK